MIVLEWKEIWISTHFSMVLSRTQPITPRITGTGVRVDEPNQISSYAATLENGTSQLYRVL